jgi:hypothetical protein
MLAAGWWWFRMDRSAPVPPETRPMVSVPAPVKTSAPPQPLETKPLPVVPPAPAPQPVSPKSPALLKTSTAVNDFISRQPDAFWKSVNAAALLRQVALPPEEKARACFRLARALLEKKGSRPAARDLLRAAQGGSGDGAVTHALGLLCFENQELSPAQEYFAAALAAGSAWEPAPGIRGSSAYYQARINELYYHQGKLANRQEVLKSWQAFLRDYGNYPPLDALVKDAKQRILNWL